MQHAAAAQKRGIPLLLLPSLRLVDLLITLRPLLLERGLVSSSTTGKSGKRERKRIVLRRQLNQDSGHHNRQGLVRTTGASHDSWDSEKMVAVMQASPSSVTISNNSSSDGNQHQEAKGTIVAGLANGQASVGTWDDVHKAELVQKLMEGSLSVVQYIQLSRLE
jgi:hypothetical protein